MLRRLELSDMDAAARIHRTAFDQGLPTLARLHTPEEDRCFFRARVFAEGGKTNASSDGINVNNADAATVLIAAATSYRSYKDVTGDPERLAASTLNKASARRFAQMRDEHVR